jgi:predicted RNA-binding protein with PIN domain
MSLLIDGYNLLNAVGIIGHGTGATSLERSRLALLNFLAESLEPSEIASTTIVFDAHSPPRGLPRALEHRGLKVRFAVQYDDADSLLEELIRADTSPRRLTVVSSDHRLQRAAHRRRARAVDSDVWYDEIIHRRYAKTPATAGPAARVKPNVPLLAEEVQRWLRQFGGQSAIEEVIAEEEAEESRRTPTSPERTASSTTEPASEKQAEIDNPFPPGYAEDLLEEDDLANPFPPGYGEDAEQGR